MVWFARLVMVLAVLLGVANAATAAEVRVLQTPGGGIQPQLVADGGTLHLIYFVGSEAHGDIFYLRSEDGGKSFSEPLRVNQTEGSAIAIGNIRGAHLAVGKNGRPHVAWMGSDKAALSGPNGATPMLYTRLRDEGKGFEAERNLIQFAAGLDGGGSVAADKAGHVYVAWHAAEPGGKTEQDRTVWVARSEDDGKSFSKETRAWPEDVGACGCCGMRAFADSTSGLYMLFRGAVKRDQRDMYLLTSKDRGRSFEGTLLTPWKVDGCPMSSASLSESGGRVVAGWEGEDQVFAAQLSKEGAPLKVLVPSGAGSKRRHPTVATNRKGEVLLAWVQDMTWKTPGRLRWTLFDAQGIEIESAKEAQNVPTWGVVSVASLPDGGFVVLH